MAFALRAGAQSCPVSCADVLAQDPTAVDGQYTIAPGGTLFSAYCHDMAGTPLEYLTLANTGGSFNFGQYTAGGAAPGTNVRTRYTRIRVDPATLLVTINDKTFSTSTGSLNQGGLQTSVNYGRAQDCLASGSSTGLANVDLRGLPFAVTDTWTLAGFNPGGSSTFSFANQVVNATGGGYCGWNSPGATLSLGFNAGLAPAPPACIRSDRAVTVSDGVTSAVPGQSLVYTIVASNAGPSNVGSVSLTDTFPAALSCTWTSVAAGGATGNTAVGSGDLNETLLLLASSSVTYTVSCAIDAGATGTLSNSAAVSAPMTDPVAGNDGATDADTVLTPQANLGITKTDGVTSAVPGQTTLTYTIVASNAGPSDAPSVTVADTFPSSLSCGYTSVAAGGATGNTSGSGDLAETLSMPVGSSATYTVSCTIDPGATGSLSNTATISSPVTDPDASNDSAVDADTVLDPEADLGVTKTDGVTSAVPGQTSLTYTIVASNAGPSDDPSASLTDTFPSSLTCSYTSVAAGGASGNTSGSGDLTETLSLPSGSSVTYTVTCSIDPAATGRARPRPW
ncbi:MAG: DUF11 domain-containing protein [bacterium]|nr:DUF11 domain-containing protein [bacterium]